MFLDSGLEVIIGTVPHLCNHRWPILFRSVLCYPEQRHRWIN